MIEKYTPPSNLYNSLKFDCSKPSHKLVTCFAKIMVSQYEIDCPIQPVKNLIPFSRATPTKIPKMKHHAISRHHLVPITYQLFIHLFNRNERASLISNNVFVEKMSVGSEKCLFG